jgi:hypothetical protein
LLLGANLILYDAIEIWSSKDNEAQKNAYESGIKEIFLFSNRELVIVEENLSYIGEANKSSHTNYNNNNNNQQFKLLDSAKVGDIVHLVGVWKNILFKFDFDSILCVVFINRDFVVVVVVVVVFFL